MAVEIDDQATPEVDVDANAVETQEGAETTQPEAPPEPFLSVNDRTVYKTKDDAVKAYNEAGQRIAQLSAWEKQAKQYGLSDPKQLDAVAKELLELREYKANLAKQAAAPKIDPADPKAKEAQQVREYLKGLGYISKEDQEAALKELREQVEALKTGTQHSEEVRFQNQEAEARNDMNSWLSAAGVKDENGAKSKIVGTLIKDWINGDDERVERWTRGGVSAKALVKEGFDLAMSELGWKAAVPAAVAAKPTDASYAANKAKAIAVNKKLPAPGTGKDAGANKPAVNKGGINSELHNRAWDVFSKKQKE
jgi:hypothetical protein